MELNPVLREMRELDRRRRAAGIAVLDVCRGARISRATYYRWLVGTSEPKVNGFLHVERTLFEIEQELFRIAQERYDAKQEIVRQGVVASKQARREREEQWDQLPPAERRRAMREWQRSKKLQARFVAVQGRAAAARAPRAAAAERRRKLDKAPS